MEMSTLTEPAPQCHRRDTLVDFHIADDGDDDGEEQGALESAVAAGVLAGRWPARAAARFALGAAEEAPVEEDADSDDEEADEVDPDFDPDDDVTMCGSPDRHHGECQIKILTPSVDATHRFARAGKRKAPPAPRPKRRRKTKAAPVEPVLSEYES